MRPHGLKDTDIWHRSNFTIIVKVHMLDKQRGCHVLGLQHSCVPSLTTVDVISVNEDALATSMDYMCLTMTIKPAYKQALLTGRAAMVILMTLPMSIALLCE